MVAEMLKIPALHVGQAIAAGPVTLFPVWTDAPAMRGLQTGPSTRVRVAELTDGPSVGALAVENLGTKPVLLLEGELLEGGWQTRILVRDVILLPQESRVVEVACVEQHRWAGASAHTRRGRLTTKSVQAALRTSDRQSQVWSVIRRYDEALGATATSSLADHLDRVASALLPHPLPGQSGVIVGVAGHPIALELFGSRSALAAHLPGVVEAATLEAMLHTQIANVPARRARRFAKAVERIESQPEVGNGPGQAWSGRSDQATLRAMTFAGGTIAHASAVRV
jgi:hypothetical protein